MRAIGSVLPFPLAEIAGPTEASLWSAWTDAFTHHAAFETARAALRALLAHDGVRRLWLPAYICAETMTAAPAGCEVRFYGDGPGLAFKGLTPGAGDAVLGVDYFGRGASEILREMARARPEVLWIEDRAQAMAPETPTWGEVVLYSPRKLIGVADGGLLVSDRPLPPSAVAATEPSAWTAALARLDDPDGRHPERWSPVFRAREAAFRPDGGGMQPLTSALLSRIAIAPLADRRRANYVRLREGLADYALWPDLPPDFTPLAFPVSVEDPARTAAAMAEQRIFCPRHWAHLPSPAAVFPGAHALAARQLSLPCDHRYDDADMDRIAAALRAACAPDQPR